MLKFFNHKTPSKDSKNTIEDKEKTSLSEERKRNISEGMKKYHLRKRKEQAQIEYRITALEKEVELIKNMIINNVKSTS